MIDSFQSIATIFMMIAIGYVLARKGILNQETNRLFSKIVIQIAMPLMIITSLPARFTLEELLRSYQGLIVGMVSIAITYGISYIIARIIKVEKKERGLFCVLSTFCNSLFIGLPVNISLYGDQSAPYVFLYYICNTFLFWTIGVNGLKKYSDKNDEKGILANIKNVFTPPLVGFILGIVLIIFNIELPKFLNDSFSYMGQLGTPMSMLFIGTVIYNIDFKEIGLNINTIMILLGRFLISPIVAMMVLSLFNLPELLNKVFVIQGAGPIISQAALVSEYYDVNPKYAAFMVGLTTIGFMFVIPLYAFIIG